MEQESIDQVVNEGVDENQAVLDETARHLNEVDQEEYHRQKTYINQVKGWERKGRKLLREGVELPKESEDYLALEEIRPHGNTI